MTLYGDTDLSRQLLGQRLLALGRQTITWNSVDVSSVRPYDDHPRAISQETPQPSITKPNLEITYLSFHANLPSADELIHKPDGPYCIFICVLKWSQTQTTMQLFFYIYKYHLCIYLVAIMGGWDNLRWLWWRSGCSGNSFSDLVVLLVSGNSVISFVFSSLIIIHG